MHRSYPELFVQNGSPAPVFVVNDNQQLPGEPSTNGFQAVDDPKSRPTYPIRFPLESLQVRERLVQIVEEIDIFDAT